MRLVAILPLLLPFAAAAQGPQWCATDEVEMIFRQKAAEDGERACIPGARVMARVSVPIEPKGHYPAPQGSAQGGVQGGSVLTPPANPIFSWKSFDATVDGSNPETGCHVYFDDPSLAPAWVRFEDILSPVSPPPEN